LDCGAGGTTQQFWTLVESAPEWIAPPADKASPDDADASKKKAEADAETQRIIEELKRLDKINYDRQRKDQAKELGIRPGTLDDLINEARGKSEKLQGRAISFPEPEQWPEPVNGAELLDDIAKAIRKPVVLSDQARDTCALWVLHTYLLDCFLVSPRCCVRGPVMRCGKTTLADVLARLVFRALPTANVSPAALFRVVEAHRPTLLIDEADTFIDQRDELRGILNSGHRKGGSVLRTVGDDHDVRPIRRRSARKSMVYGCPANWRPRH
jgi:putative DNA primase/helicase